MVGVVQSASRRKINSTPSKSSSSAFLGFRLLSLFSTLPLSSSAPSLSPPLFSRAVMALPRVVLLAAIFCTVFFMAPIRTVSEDSLSQSSEQADVISEMEILMRTAISNGARKGVAALRHVSLLLESFRQKSKQSSLAMNGGRRGLAGREENFQKISQKAKGKVESSDGTAPKNLVKNFVIRKTVTGSLKSSILPENDNVALLPEKKNQFPANAEEEDAIPDDENEYPDDEFIFSDDDADAAEQTKEIESEVVDDSESMLDDKLNFPEDSILESVTSTCSPSAATSLRIASSIISWARNQNLPPKCALPLKDTASEISGALSGAGQGSAARARNGAAWAVSNLQNCRGIPVGSSLDSQLGIAAKNLKFALKCFTNLANQAAITSILAGTPVTFAVNYGSSNVATKSRAYDISFSPATGTGARLSSPNTFSSGKFSARIKCPAGNSTAGPNAAFYLSTNADDPKRNSIFIEFPGFNRKIASINTLVNGNDGWQSLVNLQFDCSVDFHVYSIHWTSTRIMWMVDNNVLDVIDSTLWATSPIPSPSKPMRLYLSLSNTLTIGQHSWPQSINLGSGDYIASFDNIASQSPISAVPDFPTLLPNTVMSPIVIDGGLRGGYSKISIGDDAHSIACEKTQCGGRFRSSRFYPSGEFSGYFKCAAGNTSGILSSLYLSSREGFQINGKPVQDEIDFEFLGFNKNIVQTNFYVNGIGGHEKWINLGFDCSSGFHRYSIQYSPSKIVWLVDGKVINSEVKQSTKPFPKKSMFFYASVWDASGVANGGWTGKWDGGNAPYYTQYQKLRISPLKELR